MNYKMGITINDNRKITAIQEEFNSLFPYLKIEFLLHKQVGLIVKKLIKPSNTTLGECRTVHENGTIIITPNMTVADLEQKFSDIYGMKVQILRQSGKAWLETTVTDKWTLEEQNIQ
jgi:hypothetical protein